MIKKVLGLICGMCLACVSAWAAPLVPPSPKVAVMDFGTHQGAATMDVEIANAEGTSSEYIVAALVEDGRFVVKDIDLVRAGLRDAGIKTVGIIDPRQAKEIGSLLDVDYLIYGNVNDVSASETGTNAVSPLPNMGGNVTVHTVRSHIIARVMDIKSGFIIAAAKGEGHSRSSYTDVKAVKFAVQLGTETVTQESVHNAIKKAAYDTVDILAAKLFGTVLTKQKGKK